LTTNLITLIREAKKTNFANLTHKLKEETCNFKSIITDETLKANFLNEYFVAQTDSYKYKCSTYSS
jgi:hypothetical protein